MNLCDPAMVMHFISMAAGTTDGPAMDGFYQNTTQGTFFWDIMRNVVKRPTKRQRECQAPKAILLNTGEIKYPFDWQPKILDVQLLRVGNFTTMSGRRLQKAVKQKIIQLGMGPSNGYASYLSMQRYEGASTPYGPHTLSAYIKVFDELVTAMATGNPISNTEILPNYVRQSPDLSAGYGPDRPALLRRDVNSTYERQSGLIVEATFVAGNPRNDGMLEGTYLTVEEKQKSGDWKVIRTDNDYDTRFLWHSTMPILGHSEAVIRWDIDETTPVGTYRIGYFGHHRVPFEK
ncbi:Neutral/alkaline nonlysosomal ceramidase [Spinellus fusiger]|nr:Neutral/alkaline nonlysosomal ceramidase [Spinellus fusiger]